MKSFLYSCILAALSVSLVCSQQIKVDRLVIGKGKEFKNAIIKKENDYEAVISHDGGKNRVPLENLPTEWQEKLNYDQEKAEAAKEDVLKARNKSIAETQRKIREAETSKKEIISIDDNPETRQSTQAGKSKVSKTPRRALNGREEYSAKRAIEIYPDLRKAESEITLNAKKILRGYTDTKVLDNWNWPMIVADRAFEMIPALKRPAKRLLSKEDEKLIRHNPLAPMCEFKKGCQEMKTRLSHAAQK